MEIVNEEFRILSIKNFFNPNRREKEWMKVMVDFNKEIYHKPVATRLGPYNWSVIDKRPAISEYRPTWLILCWDL